MKKTNKILLVTVILVVFFTTMPLIEVFSQNSHPYPVSNFTLPRQRAFINELYIQPDINNPYQGTWVNKGRNKNVIYKIVGREATKYVYLGGFYGWNEQGVYRIDNTWILSDNNTTLEATVSNALSSSIIIFERFIIE